MVVENAYHHSRETSSDTNSKPSNKAADHKNEGFLKSAWHRLTHQHDNLDSEEKSSQGKPDSKDDDEPKKASGSG